LDLAGKLELIQAGQRPVFDHHFPVNYHMPHVVPVRAIHERPHGVDDRLEMERGHVHANDVSEAAGLDNAKRILMSHGPRAIGSGHHQRGLNW
jgi:hypothetical protein